MNLFEIMVLSALPIVELRAGIPLAFASGLNPWLAFLLPTLANMLIMFPLFIFLDYFHEHFLKFTPYHKLFHGYLDKKRKQIEKTITERGEFWALALFVAIPLPGTGIWTGTLLAWLLGVNRKKSYVSLGLGVLLAGIIVTLATLGVIKLF
ncbi:small multi-drug export protein [Candidatus Woesearchaeota archaeon]|nr:small multi-drug export protein [Candidatus Woesearchaeota archaeon]